jgi:ethanolamine ammonia-lyase small subunit
LLEAIRRQTPARILVGRSGPSYLTPTQLTLRQDHAAALDAVRAEVDVERDLGPELVHCYGLLEVTTQATGKAQYLLRPDLGRQLSDVAREALRSHCPPGADLQIVIGDGLSAAAVAAQVPGLLPLLERQAKDRGWSFGRPFFIRYCRVGVLNDIGEVLNPQVVVLLIGERPGLATAESLSAYLAYRPRLRHTDAHRNLVSNVHARGVGLEEAARRVVALAEQMRRLQTSGVGVKEELPLPEAPASLLPGPEQTLPPTGDGNGAFDSGSGAA